jgi:hypothetical protein
MTPETATQLDELDVVELRQRRGDYDEGTRGTIVSADPRGSKVTVEFEDSSGDVDLVTVDCLDLVLVQRAAKASRSSTNGR